jgi:alanine dehydrogenase
VEEGIVHYCVANMPGAFSRTATQALNNATMSYAQKIANLGVEQALAQVQELRPGLNTYQGELTCPAVGEAHDLPHSAYSV